MNPQIKILLEQAQQKQVEFDRLTKEALDAKRPFTGEEFTAASKLMDEALALKSEADKLHDLDLKRTALETGIQQLDPPDYKFALGALNVIDEKKVKREIESKVFEKVLRSKGDIRSFSEAEQKTLSRLTATDGGFWVAEEWGSIIMIARDSMLHLRRISNVIRTNAPAFNLPTGSHAVTIARVGDNAQITTQTGSSPAGNIRFTPMEYAGIVKCPDSLLRDAVFNLQGYITDRIARGIAAGEEELFMTGTGADQPLGLLNGGLTAVDISTATSATIIAEDIQSLPFELLAQYRGGASWLMPRHTVQKVALLRTTEGGANTGRFLWELDFSAAGAPPRLAGYPVYETEYGFTAVASYADGDALALFGDFKAGFTIADRISMSIQVLNELYAEYSQTGFKFVFAIDSKVTDINALRRLNRT